MRLFFRDIDPMKLLLRLQSLPAGHGGPVLCGFRIFFRSIRKHGKIRAKFTGFYKFSRGDARDPCGKTASRAISYSPGAKGGGTLVAARGRA